MGGETGDILYLVTAGKVSLAGAGSETDRRPLWLDNTYFLVSFVSLKS